MLIDTPNTEARPIVTEDLLVKHLWEHLTPPEVPLYHTNILSLGKFPLKLGWKVIEGLQTRTVIQILVAKLPSYLANGFKLIQ
jgi:hypothetical protein